MAKLLRSEIRFKHWNQDFNQLEKEWVEWCMLKANEYDSVSRAWGAFIVEQQQKSLRFTQPKNIH